jgi:hypothetical protein
MRDASRQMLWPLDPGFGPAVQQRVPAGSPAHPTTSFPHQIANARQALTHTMRRGRLPHCCCRHVRVDGLERLSGRNACPSGITPSNILSPACRTAGSWTKVRLGARAHTDPAQRAHAPPGTADDSSRSHPNELDNPSAGQVRQRETGTSMAGPSARRPA